MKKLIFILLTATAASCALACFAGCTNGQTGGGDNATEKENYSIEQQSLQDNVADEGEFGFLPPDMPMHHNDPYPHFPPHGHMFNDGARPDFMSEPTTKDAAEEEPAQEPEVKGHLRRKKNKKDQLTPDGNFSPDNAKTSDSSTTENSKKDKQPKRNGKHHAKPQQDSGK